MILVAGEALVDLVVHDGDEVAAHLGGGPFNCARAIALLEQPVAYLGRISTDRFGMRLRAQLEADGVLPDAIVATDDPTTLALAEIDADGAASYRFYTAGTSATGLTVETALDVLPAGVEMLHTGTLGLVFEPTAAALEAVAERLAPDALVMIDVNARPSAIEDHAGYRARLDRLLAMAGVVKASDVDLEYLDPGRPEVEAAAALLERGPAAVLLTRGASGVTVLTASGVTDVPAPTVQVADTIGAGDAFGGGFLAWWRREGLGSAELASHDRVVDATAFACLVAARTVERPGASPPRLAEL
jgi:fructokinase